MNEPTGRLLIVEDERAQRDALVQYLSRRGHHVVGVSTGEEALERLAVESFGLLVTDLRLPGRRRAHRGPPGPGAGRGDGRPADDGFRVRRVGRRGPPARRARLPPEAAHPRGGGAQGGEPPGPRRARAGERAPAPDAERTGLGDRDRLRVGSDAGGPGLGPTRRRIAGDGPRER
ncbi:MAG: response regulator [Holophagales bacterium]|nr:response regulator [Holophagales bacterium]